MCEELDEFQQPKKFLLFFDAITNKVGDTPKYGKQGFQSSLDKNAKTLENRTIGVYVVCGPVKGMFLYHTNDFIEVGANIMIEVQRQAMSDLARKLQNFGMKLPKHGMFQFDNCNENKNKEMFCYFSLLVETGLLSRVDLNFLIVGHTHCCIDHYFSVLSKNVHASEFIGSPLAIINLYATAHQNAADRLLVNRLIECTYNYKKAFDAYRVRDNHFINVPHSFKFILLHGKCIMLYRLFTSFTTWLPTMPTNIPEYNMEDQDIFEVEPVPLDMIGGEEVITKEFQLHKVTLAETISDPLIQNKLSVLHSMLPVLHKINDTAFCHLNRCFASEVLGENVQRFDFEQDYKLKRELQMNKLSNTKTGYIYWLKSKNGTEILPDIRLLRPSPIIAIEVLNETELTAVQGNKTKVKESNAQKTHFTNAATHVLSVANRVLSDINTLKLAVSELDMFTSYNYTHHCLTQTEYQFYKNISELGVNGLINRISNIPSQSALNWQPIQYPDGS